MDVDRLQEALKDFEKKGKKEACPELDQFLSHVAKTGETIVQWPQFKDYFMFKLETVMDDFKSSAPEPRGPPNPNVEYIPFDEMKERILKIVTGFNGIPFTIQRLCELVTDPRRNYTGTEKFLRGVEKNVMVVSCVYPSSEKNNSSSINRMNGVMFPGNSQSYTDRSNVNGPGTPRPLSRTKLSVTSPMTTNGLPDGGENKDSEEQQKDEADSDSLSPDESSPSSTVKNKHMEEDATEKHEVKRLKFDTEEEEEEEEETAPLDPSSSQSSSEMPDEAEAVCTSEEAEQDSCDADLTAEESLVTSSESAAEEADKETADDVCVTEETPEESHHMEESEATEPQVSESTDEAESTTSTSEADSECTEAEHPETFEKTPEIPPESPMDNSEEATDVADEPMEQD
ncbi:serine/threonine-protein phosphatase 4 regulatory subunit 2 [Bufo bufo]|uniref:serine/threonine-protein phosphatase 4 regulatory subunit 2 n=1 Tax=Bufo bufo TaxID=8384 RepID=UPI001ABDA19C|nr:serine/threonine-protein phosphatase 4 regulatory subunit 2 [Bufo bufo]